MNTDRIRKIMTDDILVSISKCPDNDGGTDDSVQQYCKVEDMDNNVEYGDFVLRAGDDIQEKLKTIFLPNIN